MLDFAIATLLIIFFVRGYMKGIIVAVFALLSIVIGTICALKLSSLLAAWLLAKGWVTSGWGQLFSYAILFIGVVILVRLIAKAIETTLNVAMLGWLNKIIGGVLYGLMATIVISSLLWIANQMHLIAPETIAYSKTYSYIAPVAPWVFDHIGKLIPFAKDVFGELQHFFDSVNQHLPDHVGTH